MYADARKRLNEIEPLNNIYNHIANNYMIGSKIRDDISAIILMTDVDRLDNSEKFEKLEKSRYRHDKMLFLLNNQIGKNIQEIENLLPKNSKLIAIAPDEMNSGFEAV